MKEDRQIPMFPEVHQKVRRSGVSPDLWAAVLTLRRAGTPVYACGKSHKVGDRIVDDAGLLRLAKAGVRKG